MPDRIAGNPPSASMPQERICRNCGRTFILRQNEQEAFAARGWDLPKICMECNRAAGEQRGRERQQQEDQRWQQKKEREQAIFHDRLKTWKVVSRENIIPDNDQVLYILGNGFDLMHGVRSSYYAFRDSLGKESRLRTSLENFWTPDDIWADFENALAHFDMKAMGGRHIVDSWLDIFDAYADEASAAQFFIAAEAAANPILTVRDELQERFRRWVESLTVGTEDRPLCNMFRNGKVLCFNYTEFVEVLYGVDKNQVCYIHGCRRNNKSQLSERLILGHMPGASDHSYEFQEEPFKPVRNQQKEYLLEAAQDQVFRLVAESDETMTKNCGDIIAKHEDFFRSLAGIQTIIVSGHSLSPVDWDYFAKVASVASGSKGVHWFFGCHGLRDLENLEALLGTLEIECSDVSVFQTDDIRVTPIENGNAASAAKRRSNEKTHVKSSSNGQWAAKSAGCSLKILDQKDGKVVYEVAVSSIISDVFITPGSECVFAVIRGMDPGILLFGFENNRWRFVGELERIQHQNLINPRLNRVFLTHETVTFVYNNRIRIYDLRSGRLISNRGMRGARNYVYEGEDITRFFKAERSYGRISG